jgi:hypothetical protein
VSPSQRQSPHDKPSAWIQYQRISDHLEHIEAAIVVAASHASLLDTFEEPLQKYVGSKAFLPRRRGADRFSTEIKRKHSHLPRLGLHVSHSPASSFYRDHREASQNNEELAGLSRANQNAVLRR